MSFMQHLSHKHTHAHYTHTHTHTPSHTILLLLREQRGLEFTYHDHASYTSESNHNVSLGTIAMTSLLVICFMIGWHVTHLYCQYPTVELSKWFVFCLLYMVLKKLALQYSMYLNVCCAININVYNIFYNTEGTDISCIGLMYADKIIFRVGM